MFTRSPQCVVPVFLSPRVGDSTGYIKISLYRLQALKAMSRSIYA